MRPTTCSACCSSGRRGLVEADSSGMGCYIAVNIAHGGGSLVDGHRKQVTRLQYRNKTLLHDPCTSYGVDSVVQRHDTWSRVALTIAYNILWWTPGHRGVSKIPYVVSFENAPGGPKTLRKRALWGVFEGRGGIFGEHNISPRGENTPRT